MLSKLSTLRGSHSSASVRRLSCLSRFFYKRRGARTCLSGAAGDGFFAAAHQRSTVAYSTPVKSRFARADDEEEDDQYKAAFNNTNRGSALTPTFASFTSHSFQTASSPSMNSVSRVLSNSSASTSKPLDSEVQVPPSSTAHHIKRNGGSHAANESSFGGDSNLADLLECLSDTSQIESCVEPAHPSSAPDHQNTSALPSLVPTPFELLPPRPTQAPYVELLSRLRPESKRANDTPLDPSLLSAESAKPTGAYSSVFQNSFVNPFNGRLVNVASPSAKLLFRLGFYRSPINPLRLEWSPTMYITVLQKVMADQQRTRENRKKRVLRLQKKEERAVRAVSTLIKRTSEVESGKQDTKHTNTEAQPMVRLDKDEGKCPGDASTTAADTQKGNAPGVEPTFFAACEPLSPAEAVAAARAKLLRPLRRHGPHHWMATVAQIMERQDVFTFLNKEMERLYVDLCAAYVPPKLDTPVDVAVADIELTPDQKQVMSLALQGFSMFVGGSAGTGKTVLLKAIFRELTRLGLRVAVTATTGVAAVQLGGCTFHHAFNVPVDATPHRWDSNALRAVDVVIVDEFSLLDANMFDALDNEARLARVCHAPFGGLQVIVCGDFLQLSREDTMPAYESAAFRHLVAVRLVTPMRHIAGDPLLKLLEELRRGEFNTEQFQALDRAIPASTTHITYIFPRRREAQQLNEAKLGELESREMTFTPQRGPLQLCGTFTSSALIEVSRDAHGMQKPLPSREQVLDMIQSEARRLFCSSSADDVPRIADHELVLMPVRVEGNAIPVVATRFILRLRCPDSAVNAAATTAYVPTTAEASPTAAKVDTPSGTGTGSSSSAAAAFGMERERVPAALIANTISGAFGPVVRATNPRKLMSFQARRTHRTASLFTESEWEAVAAAVASRLGGRLLGMHATEPASLVPLSVSMTLADMTSPDIAHSLSPLRLKLGCRVMINRNLSRTVSNGSVGVVEAFAPPDPSLFPRNTDRARRHVFKRISHSKLFEQLPIVRLLSGEVVQVPPVSLLVGGTAQSYYYGHEVLTVPLQLGYAFTVHKVQGLTLQGTVVLDCEKFFDCPHLIYVACSRVRRLDQLIVRHVEPRMIIVRRSALEFSERLQEACTLKTHALPSTCVRGAWAQHAAQRILAVTD